MTRPKVLPERLRLHPKDYLFSTEAMSARLDLDTSLAYTRWLATHRYENFPVVSFLLPTHLHQDFYNVYAFCRWADDLGDEIGDRAESLRLLSWWRHDLHKVYAGETPAHPVYVALGQTISAHALPREPFDNLITAFEQDQRTGRYADWEAVYAYCANSANPVGRLVLHLCGYRDEERQQLSDATCTALQLANFWQDVTVDLGKDRIYLPQQLFEKHGYTEEDLRARRFTPAFREIMREAVDEAQARFDEGLPLAGTLDRRLALDIDLFSRGGMRVLDKIRRVGYNVLAARPTISRTERAALLLSSLVRMAFVRTP